MTIVGSFQEKRRLKKSFQICSDFRLTDKDIFYTKGQTGWHKNSFC